MMAVRVGDRRTDNVRIGPISIITLIAVLCMSVLAVLSVSTAEATAAISDRQAEATKELYDNENAAQAFVAGIDDTLTSVRASNPSAEKGAAEVEKSLDAICEAAREAGGGQVAVTATMDGTRVNAEFVGEKTRRLSVTITILDGAMYRIDRWKASAVQQEAQTVGNLWMGS